MQTSIVMVSQNSNDGFTGYEKIYESMGMLYISMVKVINQPEELHWFICFNNVMDQESNCYIITFCRFSFFYC